MDMEVDADDVDVDDGDRLVVILGVGRGGIDKLDVDVEEPGDALVADVLAAVAAAAAVAELPVPVEAVGGGDAMDDIDDAVDRLCFSVGCRGVSHTSPTGMKME